MKKRVLIIAGPTAIGKTEVSIELAKRIDAEIISADSRQVYRFMNIGTAKPTREQLAAVPHHFIDHKFPNEYYSAGEFGTEARDRIDDIHVRGKHAIVVGGSGLYIRGLVDGFFEPKVADEQIKARLKKEADGKGISKLHERLKSIDPETAERLDRADSQRIMRALEVFEITGKPFSEFLKVEPQPADFEPCFFGLTMARDKLYKRIETRVDLMIEQGLVDEAKNLMEKGYGSGLNVLQTVGYKETFAFLKGEIGHEEMMSLIKQKTRNYAKRQLTWFKKDERIDWIDLDEFLNHEEVVNHIEEKFMEEHLPTLV